MRQLVLLFLCFLYTIKTQAHLADSLVRWNELSFSSPFEKSSFQGFLKENNKDFARLFLANSGTADQDLKFFEDKFNHTLNRSEERRVGKECA